MWTVEKENSCVSSLGYWIHALWLVRAEQFTCHFFCELRFCISNVELQHRCTRGHYRGFFIYAHYRSAQTSFIGTWGGGSDKMMYRIRFQGCWIRLVQAQIKPWVYKAEVWHHLPFALLLLEYSPSGCRFLSGWGRFVKLGAVLTLRSLRFHVRTKVQTEKPVKSKMFNIYIYFIVLQLFSFL